MSCGREGAVPSIISVDLQVHLPSCQLSIWTVFSHHMSWGGSHQYKPVISHKTDHLFPANLLCYMKKGFFYGFSIYCLVCYLIIFLQWNDRHKFAFLLPVIKRVLNSLFPKASGWTWTSFLHSLGRSFWLLLQLLESLSTGSQFSWCSLQSCPSTSVDQRQFASTWHHRRPRQWPPRSSALLSSWFSTSSMKKWQSWSLTSVCCCCTSGGKVG